MSGSWRLRRNPRDNRQEGSHKAHAERNDQRFHGKGSRTDI